MPNVHVYESSHEAYDMSQCDDNVKDGDVLVVPSEGSIAILNRAWPIAVVWDPKSGPGSFHTTSASWDEAMKDPIWGGDYTKSVELAIQTANSDGDITGNPHWTTATEPMSQEWSG